MSAQYSLILRPLVVGGAAVVALGAMAGVATAQTGSLDSGFGLDVDAVLAPAGGQIPRLDAIDEAVSAAGATVEAGLAGAREQARILLPPPVGGGAPGGGGGPAGGVPAGGARGGADQIGGAPAGAGAPVAQPGDESGVRAGAGINAVIAMIGSVDLGGPAPAAEVLPVLPGPPALPPLPPAG